MPTKVLVTFASKHGSTRTLAQAIGGSLHSHGCQVRVLPADLVHSVADYDAVVIGSAVYHGHWLWDGRRLLKRVHVGLTERPIWLFSSGPIGGTVQGEAVIECGCGGGTPVPAGLLPALQGIHVLDHATFAGKVDDRAAGIFEREVARGDWRNFRQVSDWGHLLGEQIAPPRRTSSARRVSGGPRRG